jgi:hypothetical protein
MRAAFLAIFFALLAGSATADQIDTLVTNLPPGWGSGAAPIINQPETASVEQLLPQAFHCWLLEDSVANYKLILSRQISIPRAHILRAYSDSYLAALVQTSRGEKIVLFRYESFAKGWWSRVFPFPPDLSPVVNGDPIMNWFDLPARRDPQLHLALVQVVSITNVHHTYTEAQNSKVSDDNGQTWYNLLNVWSGTATVKVIESPGVEMTTNFTVGFVRHRYVHSRSEPWTEDRLVKPGPPLLGFFMQKDGKWILQSGFLDPVDYLLLPEYGSRLQSLFRTPLSDEKTLTDRKRTYEEARLKAIHQAETNNLDAK